MSGRPRDIGASIGLALADARHEWRATTCLILALTAVLAPLLVLFGLRYGVVDTLTQRLARDPRNLEIVPIGAGRFDGAFFERARGWAETAFVVPRTRSIAATIDLFRDGGDAVTTEMAPTAAGDPLLTGVVNPRDGEVVLSGAAARKLGGVAAGTTINGVVGRFVAGRSEAARLKFRVVAVLPETAYPGEAAFLPLAVLEDTESFRDGFAVPSLAAEGAARPDAARLYAGFRLYGRTIHDIPALRDRLQATRIEVFTRAAEIEQLKALDANLGLLFWLIAGIGGAGFLLSLGVSLWGAVERKRRDLALLRLLGFRARATLFFPVTQATVVALLGALLALALYTAAAAVLNGHFAATLGAGERACRLEAIHIALALAATLGSAWLASILAGTRAARIEPAEGLREL